MFAQTTDQYVPSTPEAAMSPVVAMLLLDEAHSEEVAEPAGDQTGHLAVETIGLVVAADGTVGVLGYIRRFQQHIQWDRFLRQSSHQ